MSGETTDSNSEIEDLRREYVREELLEQNISKTPIDQFSAWFEQALLSEVSDPNAMSLATATKDAKPSVRIVLLKGFDEQGFRFFSNYKSRKGEELDENPYASLCFYWPELERQVRLEGKVSKLNRAESKEYFQKRPRLSQLGAWASEQSKTVESREKLEQRFRELEEQFDDQPVPMPEFWGGYLLVPSAIEFWQGRKGRLHDRLLYQKKSGGWAISRLCP